MNITIVPEDKIILLDGEGLVFDFTAPEGLHALHYDTGVQAGDAEWVGQPNQSLAEADYEEMVKPFVTAYETEKARLDVEAAKALAEAEAFYNSEEQRFVRLRAERDRRLAATDFYLAADYPIEADKLEKIKAYRQALRDLPEQEGAPWTDDTIPWAVLDI